MPTKQATHHAKLRAEGWTTIQVWLSPADQARLKTLAQVHGSATAAIRALLAAEAGEVTERELYAACDAIMSVDVENTASIDLARLALEAAARVRREGGVG